MTIKFCDFTQIVKIAKFNIHEINVHQKNVTSCYIVGLLLFLNKMQR